jgi:hypothetical protein
LELGLLQHELFQRNRKSSILVAPLSQRGHSFLLRLVLRSIKNAAIDGRLFIFRLMHVGGATKRSHHASNLNKPGSKNHPDR